MYQGDHAHFSCNAVGPLKWYHERLRNFPYSLPISFEQYLVIDSVTKENEGSYFCLGKYPDDSKYFLAKAKLIVEGDLVIEYCRIDYVS